MTTTLNPPQPVNIEDEMRASYIDYAMSVIVSRALPDVRDGLKPVQRRILYAMHDMGIRASTQHRKSARIVGEVLGKFHPHGDSSVYDALVRMAQPFTMRAPLVDGQGNFGSVDNDPAAAMRYTEARLTRASELMLSDIGEETVTFRENFDSTNREPTVLPTRLPNILVNGSNGIAVGMATNMPPHNPIEVCNAVIHLIDHPDCAVSDLMKIMPGPDLPTAATIRGTAGIRDMYATGRGRITMEAVADIEQLRNGRQRIIVTELPYQTVKSNLVEKIADLVKSKTVTGISAIRDESDRRGNRIVIELVRDAQANVVLNNLYSRTQMRSNFNAIMLALVNSEPRELTLKQILEHFIEHRVEVIRNRSAYRLKRAQERQHVVEGLLAALTNIDAVIQTIKASRDTETARNSLTERFDLTPTQSQAILEMQLRRLAALENERLRQEHEDLSRTIKQLQELLSDNVVVLDRIKEQTKRVKEQFKEPRRTVIKADEVTEASIEEMVPEESVVVSLSQRGYLKRVPLDSYRAQRRGGRGVQTNAKGNDPTRQIQVLSTHDQILFYTNQGRVHLLEVYKLPNESARTNQGTMLINLINLGTKENVRAMVRLERDADESLQVLMTRSGRVAAVKALDFTKRRQSRASVMKVGQADELIEVKNAMPGDTLFAVTQKGNALTFPASDVPIHGSGTTGVRGMNVDPDDQVVAMDVIRNKDQYVVIASEKGYAKAMPVASFSARRRGGKGVSAMKADKQTGKIADAEVVDAAALDSDQHDMFIISAKGQLTRINLSDIRVLNTRASKGVIAWRELIEDDYVTSVACFHAGGDDVLGDQPALAALV